jgi:hypothetical protein
MRLLRRRVRGFFAIQAILMCLAGAHSLTNPTFADDIDSPFRHYVFLVGYFVLTVVFAGAWLTTRKPSSYRNAWAVAAGMVSIATGVYILWVAHSTAKFATSGLVAILIGVASLYLYSQGGAPSQSQTGTLTQPAVAVKQPTAITGNRNR